MPQAPSTSDTPHSVCLVRFHDGRAKPNWGGRATSLALGRLIEESRGFRLQSVVNGTAIVDGLEELRLDRGLNGKRIRVLQRARIQRAVSIAISIYDRDTLVGYEEVERLAGELIEHQAPGAALTHLRSTLSSADEIWMNGEGDFILSPRRSLLRTLAIMQMGLQLGKPVRLLNSILSPPPAGEADPTVIDAVGRTLAQCASVCYRDPASLRLHEQLYPEVPAQWAPDALFAWARDGSEINSASTERLSFGPRSEGLDPAIQQLLRDGSRYVVLSGSSSIRSRREDMNVARERLRQLIDALLALGLEPVIVPTCSGDDWMVPVAKAANRLVTDPGLGLAAGQLLLSRASCFASGRYHPSILAALSGTPLVLMASNSHKTSSLQEVLGGGPEELPFLTQTSDLSPIVEAIRAAVESEPDVRAASADSMSALAQAVERSLPSI